MRLIDADALELEYRSQFEAVYKNVRDTVLPSDFYVERKTAYDKELVRRDMEAFCEFLQSRPIIDAEPVRHGRWSEPYQNDIWDCYECSCCGAKYDRKWKYCPECGAKMDLEVHDNKGGTE